MNAIPIEWLLVCLILLVLLSAFFSSSETAMMAVNRYRLKSMADTGHRTASLILSLLQHPDRLLGTILFGNNVANIAASTLATIIGLRLFGDIGLAYAPLALVFVVLVFAEVAPKTIAAIHPERIAFPAAYVLAGLQIVLAPFVWLVRFFSNGFLRLLRVNVSAQSSALTTEELRAAVRESASSLNDSHQEMLLRILEMQDITVEDVMVPRAKIEAIDLEDDWHDLVEELCTSHHTRVPVFRGSLDNFVGILHLRKFLSLSQSDRFTKEGMQSLIREPYFLTETSSITHALQGLKQRRRRFGVVVNEYGDIAGIVTLEQILEEIVGKFTTLAPGIDKGLIQQEDGSYVVTGNTSIRDLNRTLGWDLPIDEFKTVNGLILEELQEIPQTHISFRYNDFTFEVMQTRGTTVQSVRIRNLAED